MWVMPPILATHTLVVIVQNDCSQMLLIVCSPLPPTLSRAAWIVPLRCVFNWLPGERETTEDDRPTHHFLSLCPCLLLHWLGDPFNQNLFPQVTSKNIKLLQRREVICSESLLTRHFLHAQKIFCLIKSLVSAHRNLIHVTTSLLRTQNCIIHPCEAIKGDLMSVYFVNTVNTKHWS